ncbi:MAG: hypothetical protein K9N47_26600 [Prosthecobacter sp.]|uniref:hypothetical protein n=1 Tax=Prosthecobacter sp. TaxID=1965333 RepID=UPI0026399B7F|nr:hypothetical protein [Prosthecobacter sp.]MCF7789722.1 hypothetical protein [Prosthecobacter sp.]
MKEPEPINPYAAPKAQSLLAEDGKLAALPPRLRSVKWATFVFGAFTLIMGVLYWQEMPIFDRVLLLPIGLGLSLFGGRRKIAYFVNSGILALLAIIITWQLFLKWLLDGAFAKVFMLDRAFEALMCCLLCYLSYRYTFGLPSRRYFGVAREEAKTESPI